ncbi:hypothetical protein LVISKB_0368 [Levilactobacillus brevis KB290]|uniref:Uncharacterized protein n=1 Tax=Levilactobacillus brevis KB290 TaxID=1001583 RepID=M5AB32_LEVBR|nr:hypothetical protein LVISKB_0368 [Levilactobacillus brevis KB290]
MKLNRLLTAHIIDANRRWWAFLIVSGSYFEMERSNKF